MQYLLIPFLFLLPFTTTAQQKIYTNFNYVNIEKGTIDAQCTLVVDAKGNTTLYSRYETTDKKALQNATNLQGKYVLPALYDMHIHWPDTLVNEHINLWQNAGISYLRVMKSSNTTLPQAKYGLLKGLQFSVGFPFTKTTVVINAKKLVDSIKKEGYHFIKFFSVANEATFTAIANAASKKKLPICGHALDNVPMTTVFAAGYRSVEHVGYLENLNGKALDSAIALFKQYNVAVCPTLDWMLTAYGVLTKDSLQPRNDKAVGSTSLTAYWAKNYQTPSQAFGANATQYKNYALSSLTKKLAILKKLNDAGVTIIAGSDAEEPYQTPGYSLIEELKHIGKAGFGNVQLLQMVTTNAQQYWQSSTGKTLQQKYIVVDDNPLQDLNTLYSVRCLF